MRIAELIIERREAEVVFSLRTDGTHWTGPISVPAGLEELRRVGDAVLGAHVQEGRKRLGRDFARYAAVPPPVERALRRWVVAQAGDAVLCVVAADPDLTQLPWEFLSEALNISDLFVVRRSDTPHTRKPEMTSLAGAKPVLLAGWPNLEGLHLDGIAREILDVPNFLTEQGVRVTRMSEPTRSQLVKAYGSQKPAVLHLAPSGVVTKDGVSSLAMSREDGTTDLVPSETLASWLKGGDLRLLVLNTCNGGLTAAPVLADALATTVVGWAGWIEDKLAYDFSLFFYQRLIEGASPAQSVRAFTHLYAQDTVSSPIPVVWVPSLEAITEPYL